MDYQVRTALDMGCGSGYLALSMKRSGVHEVWASDIHGPAVTCARRNMRLNEEVGPIHVVQSDLFENIGPDERFDLIVFNAPFFFLDPRNHQECGYMCGSHGEVIRAFWDGVMKHLSPSGKVQVTRSETIGPSIFEFDEFNRTGLKCCSVAKRRSFSGHCVSVCLATP